MIQNQHHKGNDVSKERDTRHEENRKGRSNIGSGFHIIRACRARLNW